MAVEKLLQSDSSGLPDFLLFCQSLYGFFKALYFHYLAGTTAPRGQRILAPLPLDLLLICRVGRRRLFGELVLLFLERYWLNVAPFRDIRGDRLAGG